MPAESMNFIAHPSQSSTQTTLKRTLHRAASPFVMAIMLSAVLSACSTIQSLTETDSGIDYKSSKSAPKLEVPPDLTQLRPNDRYSTALASKPTGALSANGNNNAVLPVNKRARIERLGNSRYLVVDAPAEQVFPVVVDFWKDLGFTLAIESPLTGVVETDWAENRSNIPASGLRKVLGGIFDGMFDSGERDKYRSRLERVGAGTEIFISHKGTKEVATGNANDKGTKMLNRDGSAELEAEFLSRLLLRFGAKEQANQTTTGIAANPTPDRARLSSDKQALEIDDAYDGAWRRVGLALDRSGFTIDDRNYSTGEYFIRYARANNSDEGFFSKLFSEKDSDSKKSSQKLTLVLLKSTPSLLRILTPSGVAADADITKNLLGVLRDELK